MYHLTYSLFILLCLFINGVFVAFTPIPPIVFSPADYIFLVPEETVMGTIIGRLNPITNEDFGSISVSSTVMGTSDFGIDTNYNIITSIDAPDYEIFSSGPIEFQIHSSYTFQTHDYVAIANITVFITDVNDNSPIFLSAPYSFTFTQDLEPSSLIGFVSAVDSDSNPFNYISYSITPPVNSTSNISVTEEGGIMILDTFMNGTYLYEIVATDSGVPPRATTATLEIIVSPPRVPTETTDPILQQTQYHFFLKEDVTLDTGFGQVAANRDISVATFSTFLYSVPQNEATFQADASTGILSNRDDSFDVESGVTNYTFPVTVKLSIENSSEVQSQDTSTVNVYLRNVNEHSPVVAMEPFEIFMSADVFVGSVIGKLPLVSDQDGQNDFDHSLVTDSPFGINDTGFVYLKSPLDTSTSSYSLTYEVADKPLLGVTGTLSATLLITVTPASVPPDPSLPTRNVVYTHTCESVSLHSFSFTWLPPTDNSNPVNYFLTVTCFLSPSNTTIATATAMQPSAVIVVNATFDRFTECEYLLAPSPEGPSVQAPIEHLSFNNLAEVDYFVQITDQNLIFVQITNITMCLSDLYGNEQLFGTNISLSDGSSQVAQFDASYANYYSPETGTMSLVGHVSSGLLVSGTNYSVEIQFPVNVDLLSYPWYTHNIVPISVFNGALSWTQTCTPAFYTFTLSDTSTIDQSCSFVFIHASTANSFYQLLLPSNQPLSITVRDTLYGMAQWDSSVVAEIRVTQLCGNNFSPLYSDEIVQLLFLMRPGYTLSDITTPDALYLTVDPMFMCSLLFTPSADVSELTAAFQSTYDVTIEVSNDTTDGMHSCDVSAPFLDQLIVQEFTPNSQTIPAAEFTGFYPRNLTLLCDWSLAPGGVYSGRGVFQPLSSFRVNETVTLKEFTFQINPVDDNRVPQDLLVPYGTINGDTLLPKGQHVTSSAISLPNYFLIGSLYTDTAYVSNKGFISFGDPFTSPYPEIFPGYSELTRNAYIIAPFWANIDTTFLGDVSWQLHSDATLLSRLSAYVGGGFGAQVALVVTWHKVRPFPAHEGVFYRCLLIGQDYMPSCTQHNTFQAVVLSDGGENTHVLFSYNCVDFDWSKSPFNAAIGFNAGGSFYNNHHLSTTEDVALVPCTNSASTMYPQTVIAYTLSSTPGEVPTKTQEEMCRDRIAAATPAGGNLPPDFTLRSCPIDLNSVQSDLRFLPYTTSCFTPLFPASTGESTLCCYSLATGTFLSHFSTFLRYSPLLETQYATHEEGFFSLCCATRATCEEYYQVRPQVPLSGFESSGVSGAFGDPHFTTFDGFEYSFNRIGEFVLTKSGLFEAQIRATQLDTFQATCTSALVLKSSSSDVVQIEVAGDTIVAYTNNRATLQPPTFPLFLSEFGFKISTKPTNETIVVFSSGVTVQVALKSGALNFQISLPSSYRDTMVGLLGNWNGNQSDDHFQMDGTLVDLEPLTPLAREMALDTFGRTWAVTTATSLFQYSAPDTTDTYTNTSFVPVYLSELNSTTEATNICGTSTACLYDYLVANDTILATSTLSAQNDLSSIQSLFSATSPSIQPTSGTNEIEVRINVAYEIEYEVFDPVGIYQVGFSSILTDIELVLVNNLTEFRKYYQLIFSVLESQRNTEFGINVWVQSRTNIVIGSSLIVNVCDCEFGVCSNSSFTQENFLLLYGKQTCECNPGYTGTTCSEDFDACATLQCYPEVSCVDMPPPSLLAECATCPNGTTGDGRDCEDYNECVGDRTYLHNCSDVEYCRNVIGSFECVCIEGYERDIEGVCVDIDECVNPVCHQNCVNTNGSYRCDCVAGLTLSSDTISCEPIVPCATSECDTESQICGMLATNQICFCKRGYMPIETNSFLCLDSNECDTQICSQECVNEIGSYTCSCESGFSLSSDNRTCVDVNECVSPATCSDTFVCSNLIGSHRCVDPLNPFPFNSSTPVFSIDIPAIVAGSVFAAIMSVLILTILIYLFYRDVWRSWRRRGRKDGSESEIESGTNFNIFRNH